METINTETRTIRVEEVIEILATIVVANNGDLDMIAAPSRNHCRMDAALTIAALLEIGGQWREFPDKLTEEEWDSIQHGADLSAALGHDTVTKMCGW